MIGRMVVGGGDDDDNDDGDSYFFVSSEAGVEELRRLLLLLLGCAVQVIIHDHHISQWHIFTDPVDQGLKWTMTRCPGNNTSSM